MEEDGFMERLIFSDEATFHISGKVNRSNIRIWGTEHPHAMIEHQRDSEKANVFCAVSRKKVHGPFFFNEATVSDDSFLNMLENWLLPELNSNSSDYIPQLDGATFETAPFFCEDSVCNIRFKLGCVCIDIIRGKFVGIYRGSITVSLGGFM
jgi:hypothetical protein